MTEETTLPQEGMNVTDEIADLLAGDDDARQEIPEPESEGEEETTQEEESTEDTDDLSDEQSEESTDDVDEILEQSWGVALGVDDSAINTDDDGAFNSVNIKVDGEESTVGMKDLIAGYQTNKHNTNTSKSLAADRKEFETVRNSAVESYTTKLNDVAKLSEYMHKQLLGDYQSVDWNGLRERDPAEYAALMQDYQRRDNEIKQVYQAIEQERSEQNGRNNETTTADIRKRNISEMEKVKANNPSWDTDEKIRAGFTEIGTFVGETYGIDQDHFNGLNDSRYIEIMKDAMAYRKGAAIAKKKVAAKLPKYQKSKTGKAKKPVSKVAQLTKAAKNASGSNKRELQTSAITELLGGL